MLVGVLETCEYLGRDPQRPLKGSFNVRVSPDLHKSAVIRAKEDGTSLNKVVARSLEAYLNGSSEVSQNITINMPPDKKIETYAVTPSTEATWGPFESYEH
ncbi:MAG: type II toxin-antitoxin system HicB family antitoxin [Candidatus Electrothrix sp. ATG2]|nr:type II toxin-antitoxin system HicB family antitoxin [Candidatus Electrothrix sp. ATG2]